MLASGTASFSDMYFFFGGMVPAILESGIKCNLSRGLTVFDDSDYTDLPAYRDNVRLRGEWNGANNGRLIGDLCIHGEYTSNPKIVEAVAQHAVRPVRASRSICPRRRPSTRSARAVTV